MANVLFKRGLQSALPASGSATDGVFYLTTDTHRLYVGQGTDPVLLNKTVRVKSDIAALSAESNAWSAAEKLAHVEDFYYASAENVLCFWNGTQWQQINKNTDTTIDTITLTNSATNNVGTISLTIAESNSDSTTASTNISGANGIKVTTDNGDLVLTGRTYSLDKTFGSDNKSVTLKLLDSDNGTTAVSSIPITGGNNVTITNSNGAIHITSENTTLESANLGPSNGNLTLTIADTDSNSTTATLGDVGIVVGENSDQYVSLVSGASDNGNRSLASLYTKSEIDHMINGLNGMTLIGTIGNNGATTATLPTSGVKQGDTYIITSSNRHANDYGGTQVFDPSTVDAMANGTSVGDMLIATGTETDGVITSNLKWVYIPAGNDSLAAVTYSPLLDTTANKITLAANDGEITVAELQLNAGTGISISSTTANGNKLISTISHTAYAAVTPTAASTLSTRTSSFTAIKSLTLDNGHITGIETDTFQPITYEFSDTTVTNGSRFNSTTNSGSNDVLTSVELLDDNSSSHGTATFQLKSDSIKLSAGATSSAIQMDIEWGSF